MKSNYNTYALLFMGLMMMTVISCKYDDQLPFIPDPGIQYSFSEDIIPIFDAGCSVSSCHNGTIAPDLRPANAYESLWAGALIDTVTAANSELYLWMNGDKYIPMPPAGPNPVDNATVLQWIEQGAKNN